MKEQFAHIVLNPLTCTLGIVSEASDGSPARVGSMPTTALASRHALDSTDGQ
ncbi:hypothetical protein VC273_21820 [Xanthomonas nasturtii]|uniref:hypothetical protein n=1 Tax=Xanthomonas TaxID=338 RepID=UPI002B226ED0|nr:hypothetical protein [Xanthomonas nasturtii]MEA9558429.1 hypothetical protein [Xanthomonas nasturtii]